ncbi:MULTISPECIES: flagellar hook-basal body complex protein FliE [Paenibacillus]|jgi:flagellar hook-basal body complex protein FliE|uniref:Flagellar hook-basal body complex protein FliE n=1 Tax=Paenibacillus illinoisensis TaxID=59845 RepID=A0A2W0C449_9BACL|nr:MULTISPECIES: flagellar hook-basal body complex protein FliE [Paenibacillus]MBM6387805.1 flagellar hook-basal body complex protein FliE [Paenibacillus sp.]PAD32814.1 flagellar hook-basal body complex protein FliE [Paenibacillus sp. 7523-1]PYY26787.1 Flagellar hook-basal body complex protein FliE [Paenibacillus illinoisensis]
MIQNNMFNTQVVQPLQMQNASVSKTSTPAETIQSFGTYLQEALGSVATQEKQAHEMSNQFLLGNVNVDQVMIASEQALLSLQLTSQVRNKVVEAYQEIMRTQM